MYDEVIWRLIHLHLFARGDVILAFVAVPLVVSAQGLLHLEVVEAVVDRRCVPIAHLEASCCVQIYFDGLFDQLDVGLGA